MAEQPKNPFDIFKVSHITEEEDFIFPIEEENDEVRNQEETKEGQQENVLNSDNDEVEVIDETGKPPVEDNTGSEEDEPVSFAPLIKAISENNGWDADGALKMLEEAGVDMSKIDSLNSFVSKIIEDSLESVFANDEVRQLNEFISSGGTLETYYKSVYDVKGYQDIILKENDESTQERVYRDYLKAKGWKDDKISKYIQRAKDAEELYDEANEALSELKEIEKEASSKLIEKQKKIQEEQAKQYQAQLLERRTKLLGREKFAGFEAPTSKREALYDYMFKKDPKTGLTPREAKYKDNPDLWMDMAFLEMENYSKDKFEKKNETKITKTLVEKLSTNSDVNAKVNNGAKEVRSVDKQKEIDKMMAKMFGSLS
jgi:hypothetical protein